MNQLIKTQLKIWTSEILIQVTGARIRGRENRERFILNLFKLDSREKHILRERRKMTTALWHRVMNYYGWRCARCGATNFRNRNLFRPTMEVDHIVALWNWGFTVWSNLQVLCKPCNRSKWTKTADYRH